MAEASTGMLLKRKGENRPFPFLKYQYIYTTQGFTIRIKNTNKKHHHAKSIDSAFPPLLLSYRIGIITFKKFIITILLIKFHFNTYQLSFLIALVVVVSPPSTLQELYQTFTIIEYFVEGRFVVNLAIFCAVYFSDELRHCVHLLQS